VNRLRYLTALRFRRTDWPWPALELAAGDGPGHLVCPLTLDFLRENHQ
jgi:hypothetical protein